MIKITGWSFYRGEHLVETCLLRGDRKYKITEQRKVKVKVTSRGTVFQMVFHFLSIPRD